MITILLSHERSGSHLVGSYIKERTKCFVFDEVCNIFSVSPEHEASFHRYQVEFIRKNKDLYLSSKFAERLDFVKSYFDHLLVISGCDNICVDVKYGHLHNFDWFWNPIFRRPLLLELSEQHGYKLLHLYRKNVVEASVSAIVADKRRVWHSWQFDDCDNSGSSSELHATHKTLELPCEFPAWRIAKDASLIKHQNEWIKSNWIGNTPSFEVIYEDFVSSIEGDQSLLHQLSEFLGSKPSLAPWTPSLLKLGRSMQDTIANYSEVRNACEEIGLAGYL